MKIHWLHFDVYFFDEPKIQIIESKPLGDTFIKIWVRLLCLAMKSSRPGFVEMADGMPYEIDSLATVTRTNVETMKDALKLFFELQMINVTEGTPIEIVNFRKDQNLDYIEVQREKARIRMQKYRIENGLVAVKPVTRNKRARSRIVQGIGEDRIGEEKKGEEINKELAPVSQSPDVDELFDLFYQNLLSKKLLPIDAKGKAMFFGNGKKHCAEILKQNSLEDCRQVLTWAFQDTTSYRAWASHAIFPSDWTALKSGYVKAYAKGSGKVSQKDIDEMERYMEETNGHK